MLEVIPNNRITPQNITKESLLSDQIFGFGSNESGIHGAGAAAFAMELGAIWGRGVGIQGQTYAIPTKDKTVRKRLSLIQIKPYIDQYIDFCKLITDKTFLTTEIGCGYAGYTPYTIAPLFVDAIDVDNIWLTESFWRILL